MHLKPDHDPGTAFISFSGQGIRSSGVRCKAEELGSFFFFILNVI